MFRRRPSPAVSLRAFIRRAQLFVETLEDRVVPAAADWTDLTVNYGTYEQDAILVRLRPGVTNPNALNILPGTSFTSALPLVPGLWEVSLSPGVSVGQALAAYGANPFVLGASPNHQLRLNQTPDDPQFGSQWGLNNTGQTGGTADADIDAPQAWDVTTGSSSVIVAVLDTGIDYTHPDLAANMWTNSGEIANNGLDDDGNGYVDDRHGYDFANDDGNPMDDHGHGTHVAGTIGAVGDNGIGVTGVAWNVRLMALKFLDSGGNGSVADAIRALNYAVANGAKISNNSYGGNSAEDADPLFLEAIQNAADSDHVFVAGAGNSSADNDQGGFYPANFAAGNIISVAATDNRDRLASFSNYGATTVDVAAPGVDILSTLPGNSYGSQSGTSMATPHVTGVVALVRSLHPTWTYQQVISRVLNTVDYVPGLDGRVATAGRVNAARALVDNDGPQVVFSNPSGGVGGSVATARVTFNERVDPATFTLADVVSFTGPNGAITATGVSVVPGSLDRTYNVTFATQVTRGTYQMVLGPNITDVEGHLMDQDGDGTFGEATADQFTVSFTIGDQYTFHSTDTPKSLVPLSTTASLLTVADDLGIADLDVRVSVTSGDVGFLSLELVAPSGTRVSLAPMTGNFLGSEYDNTVFDDEATTGIGSGTAPFTGSYRPAGDLSSLDDETTAGTWRLEALNLFGGSINSWSLLVVADPPRMTIDDVLIVEGNSGTSTATFTVRLSNILGDPVTVDYATAPGTATPGIDYESTSGTLTFAPGELTKTITVTIAGDTLDEGDETFFVNLSNASNGAIFDGQGVGTIVNDETSVSINDLSVAEGNGGTINSTFTLTLSNPSAHPVTVNYSTAAGTSTANIDYVTTSGSITFNPGETSRTITVGVKGDTRYESGETFLVNLTATNAMVADGQGVGTITNDDAVPLVTVADMATTEGQGGTKTLTFTVALSSPTDDTVTVNYTSADGTALAGIDYTAVSGALTFTPGQTTRSVTVTLATDTDLETTETFFLNLSSPVKALIMDGQAVGTIQADELSITVDDATVLEGDGPTFDTTFVVRLSAPAPFDVTVGWTTGNGSAGNGSDFVHATGTLTIAAGQTVGYVTVLGIGDVRDETNETFVLNLANPVNALIGDTQGQATITDDDAQPTVSVSDGVVVEGPNGTRNLNYTIKLSAVSGQTITVNYATADGTATAGSDYQPRSGTLTFGAGSLQQVISVPVNGDTTSEADETVLFALSNAVNVTVVDGNAVGTIQDDDSLIVQDVAVVEGDAGTSAAVFTVRLLTPRATTVTVDYATANGTAQNGYDYLTTAGTLTFAPGETEKTVAVAVVGDRFHESADTMFLNLTNPVGILIADAQAVATITNDDATPLVTVSDAVVSEGQSATRNASFTLTLSEISGQAVVVTYATADGTATTTGGDYQPRSGTITFGPGTTVLTLNIPVNGDTAAEGAESFLLNLTAVTNATLADNQATAVIYDDDPLPSVSVTDVSTSEGQSGTKNLSFTLTLSSTSTQTITVQAATSNDTATAGSDYTAKTELVTFTPGQGSRVVHVVLSGDTAVEAAETLFLLLSSPTNAVLGDAQATGLILNDDSSLAVSDVTVTEGNQGTANAVFTVTLTNGPATAPVTVTYVTNNGTAAATSDYVATSGALTFAPGETTKTVTALVLGDLINEVNETFFLNLSNASNATIADFQGVATINDAGDAVPTITVADAVLVEGNSGTRNLSFTVKLSMISGKTVTVNYATANGSATAGSDYQARSGTLSFGPGALTQSVSVPLNVDVTGEIDETFLLNLSTAVNATIGDNQAVGTIQDDDSLTVGDVVIVEGDGGTSTAEFTVRLLAPRSFPVSVDYVTANGTGSAGIDYLPVAGSLTFAAGETEKVVSVPVVADRLHESNDTFFLNLSNAVGTILADTQGLATITNDDAMPTLTVTGMTLAEGNSGTRNITFTVRLSEASGQNVTISYATADGTATVADADYQPRSGTFSIGPGGLIATVNVPVNPDLRIEGNETFRLVLSNAINAVLAESEATAIIFDDDSLGMSGSSWGSLPGQVGSGGMGGEVQPGTGLLLGGDSDQGHDRLASESVLAETKQDVTQDVAHPLRDVARVQPPFAIWSSIQVDEEQEGFESTADTRDSSGEDPARASGPDLDTIWAIMATEDDHEEGRAVVIHKEETTIFDDLFGEASKEEVEFRE